MNINLEKAKEMCPAMKKGTAEEGFVDQPEGNHLEGIQKFERPMQDYFRMADGLSQVFVINLGIKYGLFDAIEQCGDRCSVDDIISKTGFKTPKRHLIDFLDQMLVHGLLEREGLLEQAKYRLTEYSRKYLLKSSPSHYNYVFLNLDRYMKKYQNLEKTFPSGKTEHLFDDAYSNEEDLKCYMEYFYKSNEFNFDYLLEQINFEQYERVVDIHGLKGLLAAKIKKRYPKCEVISFDNDKLKSCAETYIKGHNMQDNVKLEFGDFRSKGIFSSLFGKGGLKSDCDCVLAPHILMHFGYDNKKRVLEGIFNSLRKNGELIIMENLIDENRTKDSCGLKISFIFSMMGYEGYACSFNEYKKLLTEAGFGDINYISHHEGFSDLIIAKKLKDSGQ